MVSHTRSVSSRSRSARSGGAGSNRSNASHSAPKPQNHGSHRANGPQKKQNKRKHLVLKWVLGIFAALLAAGIGLFAYMYITTEIPEPEKFALAEKTTVYYADGTTEIGSYAEQNREIIDCAVLPDYVGNAIVASEDRSFYTNKGIDLYGIARALYTNLTTGSRQGGSTITQQYAERYYLGETTSYSGKLREAFLAIKIAQAQDKSQVLCNYMNTIYLGRGAYGIQAAAKAYFNKNASDLTLSESAMLAGIIPAPSSWDPAVNQEQAEKRYDRVLSIMKEDGYITAQEKKEAQFPAVSEIQQSNQMAGANGYLLTTVKNELVNSKAFTADDLETGGYKIVTTLDKDMQDEIQQVGDTRPEGMPESIQVGGIAVDQKTGSVKAMYAGNDYLTKQLNNATQATFEPGSTMKPFGLLGAAQEGVNFNTLFNGNSGLTFETTPGTTAQVPNALNTNWGYINLYQATANSVNTVFMEVNKHLGAANLAKIAHQAGIEEDIAEDTTYNILGINGITVWDLAQGHSTIANDGVKNTLHIVDTVLTSDGSKELYKTAQENQQVFDANDCHSGAEGHAGHHHVRHRGRRFGTSRTPGGRQVRHRKRREGRFVRRLYAATAQCVGHLESCGRRQRAGSATVRRLWRFLHRLSVASVRGVHVTRPAESGGDDLHRANRQRQNRRPGRHMGHRRAEDRDTAESGDAEGRGEHRADHTRSYAKQRSEQRR